MEHILQSQLEAYAAQAPYPLHMPGHKRRMAPAPGLPFSWDVTEVPGTDDLHDAHGILEEAMQRSAALWGAERTWYLVGGSTCGILAGIRALGRRGDAVLCARNCHKAVYHALELAGYRAYWILPGLVEGWDICAGLAAGDVEAALRRHPEARAVILTSPTYEGVLSDVEGIAAACHRRGIPLLVDEAHGAHLMPLSRQAGFPAGALACGADLVVQSPHKTLPSLTQTGFLHLRAPASCPRTPVFADLHAHEGMQGTGSPFLVDPARIEEGLDVFETSSPSYPLLASLDGCTGILRERGEALFGQWAERLGRFYDAVRPLQRIRVLGVDPGLSGGREGWARGGGEAPMGPDARQEGPGSQSLTGAGRGPTFSHPGRRWPPHPSFFCHDPGKILMDVRALGMSGPAFAGILRERYGFETEMARGAAALAMTSLCDAREALDRLAAALLEMDEEEKSACGRGPSLPPTGARAMRELLSDKPHAACTLADAAAQPSEPAPLEKAAGRICAEYLYYYPPGIPVLAPGEWITAKKLQNMSLAAQAGILPYRRGGGFSCIRCLRE